MKSDSLWSACIRALLILRVVTSMDLSMGFEPHSPNLYQLDGDEGFLVKPNFFGKSHVEANSLCIFR